MGTRHLTIVKLNGVLFGQYGQWDGYPNGAGSEVLEFLGKRFDRETFAKNFATAHMLSKSEEVALWSALGVDPKKQWISLNEASAFKAKHPQLDRDMGAGILDFIQKTETPQLRNQIDFAADSLMCEWAWMVDLDAGEFVAFSGFNKKPLAKDEPFAHLEGENSYYPIRLVARWRLDDLPSEEAFLASFKDDEEEE